MIDTTLLAFAGVSLLLAVTPGPDMAVVTKNALAHGRRGVVLTTSGIALALAVWVTATAVGNGVVSRIWSADQSPYRLTTWNWATQVNATAMSTHTPDAATTRLAGTSSRVAAAGGSRRARPGPMTANTAVRTAAMMVAVVILLRPGAAAR